MRIFTVIKFPFTTLAINGYLSANQRCFDCVLNSHARIESTNDSNDSASALCRIQLDVSASYFAGVPSRKTLLYSFSSFECSGCVTVISYRRRTSARSGTVDDGAARNEETRR